MPAPVLTVEQWGEVEKAAVAGVPFTELAKVYGIEDNAIRQRAYWKKWAVPYRVQKLKAEYLAHRVARDSESTEQIPDKPDQFSRDLTASNVVAESLAEYGQKGAILVAKGMLPLLERTMSEGSELLTKDITDWKTFGSAFGTYAKATQLDKPQQAVQVNVWGGDWSQSGSVPVDE